MEPVSDAHRKKVIAWSVTTLCLAILITGVVLYCVFCHKRAEKKLRKAQDAKIHAD